ncbi:hypothetical protein [Actinokineospora sp. NBRC 105648]|uniref:hypothetical protein n=1 Tax=Actinokineospora sp. NBRC 105648 TaxID=3032206 RepID=UPI0024A0D74E|nr:hypothetical protein [Actinokineospora sp. NBRC 105648]GLZ39787.1 hypothetical protein Acsp05_34110 [Actinokineospora sp. NBRC 105648]
MAHPAPPDRAAVLALLAGYGDRSPGEVGEVLDSLELTWLVAQVEQRYGVELELTDEVFAGMGTVTGAVGVLAAALAPEQAPAEQVGHG